MADLPRYRASFPSTRWSLVIRARDIDPRVRRQAFDQLLRTYSPALEAFLIVGPCRLSADDAEELVQSFLVEKVLERDLLAKADPAKGKLRSLVLKSLHNYVIDSIRRRKLQGISLEEVEPAVEPASPNSTDYFDQIWARHVLNTAMQQMLDECLANGREDIWALFEARVTRPALEGVAPVDYEALVRQFQLASPEQAANVLVTAKRHFRRVLERMVAQYADDEEIELEIHELRTVMAAAGPLGLLPTGGFGSPDATQHGAQSADESSPSHWATMFDAMPHRDELWSAEEHGQLLEHQLLQPLHAIFSNLNESLPPRLAENDAGQSGGRLETLGDLLIHPEPPLELLDCIKRWARTAARDDASQLPSEVSSLIYFAAIAAAQVRCGRRITKSDDATLRYGFTRVLMHRWNKSEVTELISAALRQLDG